MVLFIKVRSGKKFSKEMVNFKCLGNVHMEREGGLVHRSKSGSHELIGRDESDRLGGSPAGSV